MKITVEPPYEMWPEVLSKNRHGLATRSSRLGRARVREALYEAAFQYTQELTELAASISTPISGDFARTFDYEKPLVMAGHQPVVYHQGLLYKNKQLSRLAKESSAHALNVVVDTDEGDAGQLIWPFRSGDSLTLRSATVSSAERLFASQRIVESERVREIFCAMRDDLAASGLHGTLEAVERVSRLYQSLAGQSVAIANSLVRWTFEERAYLEVPLSRILRLEVVQGILLEWVRDAEKLVPIYNSTLESYRAERKIKNPANPFPNMSIEPNSIEVPFWLIQSNEREPLMVAPQGRFDVRQDSYIAPRGSVVTLLLRAFCSDLFVHGTGGSKYDPFVDRFAHAYLGVELPSFVVASSTEYAFPERVAAYEAAIELKSRYKEIVSHTERFLGIGLFSSDEEEALHTCAQKRRELLARLNEVRSSDERSVVTRELNRLNQEIKQTIDASALAAKLLDAQVPEVVLSRWRFRTYPFWLFVESSR
jgi:hypothetical protein